MSKEQKLVIVTPKYKNMDINWSDEFTYLSIKFRASIDGKLQRWYDKSQNYYGRKFIKGWNDVINKPRCNYTSKIKRHYISIKKSNIDVGFLVYLAYNLEWSYKYMSIYTRVIDHIDGNSLNNSLDNLIPPILE